MSKKEEYGKLKLTQIKELLKEAGAPKYGRKEELVDRLILWQKNNNFGYEPINKDPVIVTPDDKNYKDINASSPLPAFSKAHLDVFIKNFQVPNEKAEKMYQSGFLQYIRYCQQDEMYYVKSSCKAELRKHMKYICDINLFMDGEVIGSSCDCPVGQSENAHCKHIICTLIALSSWKMNGSAIMESTCTEKLQTFHKPSKKYNGSPIKSTKFTRKITPYGERKSKKKVEIDLSNADFKTYYVNYFNNIIKARGINNNMSIKQITCPANLYAFDWDHGFYTKQSYVDRLFISLGLSELSEEDAQSIEFRTIKQGNSPAWAQERSIRMTASLFHSCCHTLENEDGAKALAQKILNPVTFTSKATNHGKVYESVAVDKFNELNNNLLNIQECGLFVPTERPYLGGSPDRLLAFDSLIEVKCPYARRHCEINEITVPYLKLNCYGHLELSREHPYFYQIQGQLYVTKRKFCDLVVYTFNDLKRISIERDDTFIELMLEKLDLYYMKFMKPAIIEKYLYKNYSACM